MVEPSSISSLKQSPPILISQANRQDLQGVLHVFKGQESGCQIGLYDITATFDGTSLFIDDFGTSNCSFPQQFSDVTVDSESGSVNFGYVQTTESAFFHFNPTTIIPTQIPGNDNDLAVEKLTLNDSTVGLDESITAYNVINVKLLPDVTVKELNAALNAVGGNLLFSWPELETITIHLPTTNLSRIESILRGWPGVDYTYRESVIVSPSSRN